jgi:pimeloyl-ACP methyl ester carboxylesterase
MVRIVRALFVAVWICGCSLVLGLDASGAEKVPHTFVRPCPPESFSVSESPNTKCWLVRIDTVPREVWVRAVSWTVRSVGPSLLVIPGGPGLTFPELVAFDVSDSISEKVLSQYANILSIDPRGTVHSTPVGCSFLPATNPLFVGELGATCSGDERYARTLSAGQVAEDIDQVVRTLQLQALDVLGNSWGGSVAASVAVLRPKWLRKTILDSPAVPLGYPEATRDSMNVFRRLLKEDSALGALYARVVGSIEFAERSRLDLLISQSVIDQGLREAVLNESIEQLRKRMQGLRMGEVPHSSYIGYLCSTFTQQAQVRQGLLEYLETKRSQLIPCDNLKSSPHVATGKKVGDRTPPPNRNVRVLCSTEDWRAPPEQCSRFAKQFGVRVEWFTGIRHGNVLL